MFACEAPIGHQGLIEGLWRARELGRLSHALLFEGPAGIGKFHSALWFAKGLFCERRADPEWSAPCDVCGACKRFAAGSHPDVFVLDPIAENLETIPVARIAARDGGGESACDFFSLRAMEGGMRVVIIREFERANAQAQNALLKTLEEPGESALLILESSRSDLLLDTVRSRCVTVRFAALDRDSAAEVLRRADHGAAPELVAWAHGSPGKALQLSREGATQVRAHLVRVLRGELDPLLAAQELLDLPGEFAGKTPTAQTRARTRAILELLTQILRDGLHVAMGVPAADLAHADVLATTAIRERPWRDALEQVMALRGELELNLSPLGILDRALLAVPVTPG